MASAFIEVMKLATAEIVVPDLLVLESSLPTCCRITSTAGQEATLVKAWVDAFQYDDSSPAAVDPDDPYYSSSTNSSDQEQEEEGERGTLTACPVFIVGNMKQRREEFADQCQICKFDDFEGLGEYMRARRARIAKRHKDTLRDLHQHFRGIVQQIVQEKKLYHSALHDVLDPTVALFATPNVRVGRGSYARFLHCDATFAKATSNISDNNNNSSSSTPRAMLNIWICLNDTPPRNQLMFYSCGTRQETHPTPTLSHAVYKHVQGQTLVYDATMCWGSFYCFVAGQAQSAEPILLHAGVDLPDDDAAAPFRKSVELRYVV